jgi:hypothetical protein
MAERRSDNEGRWRCDWVSARAWERECEAWAGEGSVRSLYLVLGRHGRVVRSWAQV